MISFSFLGPSWASEVDEWNGAGQSQVLSHAARVELDSILVELPSGALLSVFWGQGVPLKSTNQQRMPFFLIEIHWASELVRANQFSHLRRVLGSFAVNALVSGWILEFI